MIASCSQSTDEKEEYQTRMPLSFVSENRESVKKPPSLTLNALEGASYADIVFALRKRGLSLSGDHERTLESEREDVWIGGKEGDFLARNLPVRKRLGDGSVP